MHIHLRVSIAMMLVAVCSSALAATQDIDTQLSQLADDLSGSIKDHAKKKVTVIDFTDLEGKASELGRYIAEQLTVDLVMGKRDFAVLDRANLKSILAEHKLTATGLVDPANAKKLGQFAGVDAIILGTIIPKKQTCLVTAKIITTDTAEIVGAAKSEFRTDDTVAQLLSKPASESEMQALENSSTTTEDRPAVTKSFEELGLQVEPLKIVNYNQVALTMTLTNHSTSRTIWVALDGSPGGWGPKDSIRDASGIECPLDDRSLSGINEATQFVTYGNGSGFGTLQDLRNPHPRFQPALELSPNSSSTVTMRFQSHAKLPQPGRCTLQLVLLLGHDFVPGGGRVAVENLIANVAIK